MSAPPYPLHPTSMKKSWIERNPVWKIPLGCMILFLLVGGFGVGMLTFVMGSFRNSDVYKQALALAEQNQQVREQLGEPMKPAWFLTGQLKGSGSTGDANLSIPISGPRGTGHIRAVAHKSGGVWHFTWLRVDVAGQSGAIDLLSAPSPAVKDF
jgi:hypothetical protein